MSDPRRLSAFIDHVRLDIYTRLYQGSLRYHRDLRTLEHHLPMAREIGDVLLVGRLYLTMAMVNEFAGYFDLAIQQYDQAYATFAEQNLWVEMAKARNNLAELHRLAGRPDMALQAYSDASRLVRRDADHTLLPLVESNIGLTWLGLGDFSHAEAHFLTVIRLIIDEGISNTDALMKAHRGLAEVYLAQQNFPEAWRHVNLALELAQGMEDKITLAEVDLLRAKLAEADPHPEVSPRIFYQMSRAAVNAQNAPMVLARTLLEEARYLHRLGDLTEARTLAQQAYYLFDQLNLPEEKQAAAALCEVQPAA